LTNHFHSKLFPQQTLNDGIPEDSDIVLSWNVDVTSFEAHRRGTHAGRWQTGSK
jgi:hypothetical protein